VKLRNVRNRLQEIRLIKAELLNEEKELSEMESKLGVSCAGKRWGFSMGGRNGAEKKETPKVAKSIVKGYLQLKTTNLNNFDFRPCFEEEKAL
jgi:hypothetical protein